MANIGELTAPDASTGPRPAVLRILPNRGQAPLDLRDLWRYRELIYVLALREIKVKYKQTAVGVLWALIQPVSTMLLFTLFFGRLGKMPSEGLPYALFTLAALVPWTLFSTGLMQTANSLIGNANLITKVYFPRLVIPISAVLSGLLDFAIGFLLLVGLMTWQGFSPTLTLIWAPAFVVLALITSLGTGLWLAALNVQYRDVRYVLPFLTQFWMFATPIAYSGGMLSERWRMVYDLNPMVGVVEGFRWAVLGHGPGPGGSVAMSATVALAVLISGLFYFRRMERTFADSI